MVDVVGGGVRAVVFRVLSVLRIVADMFSCTCNRARRADVGGSTVGIDASADALSFFLFL